jgi:prepilin-type processing-associated H-X9-DG protein/prepilin-type N-terminal cleavage/methylation domain-containing protein
MLTLLTLVGKPIAHSHVRFHTDDDDKHGGDTVSVCIFRHDGEIQPDLRAARASGFTLVELLVVMGIIGALIAILLPALGGARRAALAVTCKSNLRQIQIGVLLYAHNARDYLPGGGLAAGATLRNDDIWFRQIDPYLKNRVVYVCPSASGPRFVNLGSDLDYVANSHLIRVGKELKLSVVVSRADYACLLEGDRSMSNFQWTSQEFNVARVQWTSVPAWATTFTRHSGSMHVAYLDGHVAAVRTPLKGATPDNFGELADAKDGLGLWSSGRITPAAYLRRTSTAAGF